MLIRPFMHESLRRNPSHGSPPVQPNLTPDLEEMANEPITAYASAPHRNIAHPRLDCRT
jgi:hypothetical protein